MTNQVNKYPAFNTFNDTWSLWIWRWVLHRLLKAQSLSTTALLNMCSPGQSYSTHLCNSSKKICFERRSKSLFHKLLLACTLNLHALLLVKISMKTLRLRRERTRLSLLLVSFVCEVDTVLYIYSLPTDLWSFSFFKEI